MAVPVQPQAALEMQELFRLLQQQQAQLQQQQALLEQRQALFEQQQAQIQQQRAQIQQQQAQIEAVATGILQQRAVGEVVRIQERHALLRNEIIQRITGIVNRSLLIDGVKIAGKAAVLAVVCKGGEELAKKLVTETARKALETTVLKRVPVIGLAIGIGSAFRRFCLGHSWLMIGGEIASGAASCFPGAGTAVSVGMDILLVGGDLMKTDIPAAQVPTMSLEEAYQLLNLEAEVPDLAVRRTCRELLRAFHPDVVAGLQEHVDIDGIRACIIQARNLIFRARGLVPEEGGVHG